MKERKNSPLRFKSTIKIRIGNPYIFINRKIAQEIRRDWKKPMPVLVQVNGKPDIPWKINMMPIGNGAFYLYLHGDVRKASNTKVGDRVLVDVCFDMSYKSGPQHPIPKWFKVALDKNETAKKNWEALIPSRKKEILRYFSWLKSQDTIDRNLKRAIGVLSGKQERFMARLWKDGV
jgi:hypothetical protein